MYTRNAHPRLRDLPKRRAWPSRFITLRLDVRPREPITSVVQPSSYVTAVTRQSIFLTDSLAEYTSSTHR